ncbi:MAG: hypothetical protein ACXWBN_07075, partial [Acidimicrobiales bacterium]
VDETAFLAATPTHPTLLVTGFVDLDRHRLIDVVEGRTAAGVRHWLGAANENPAPLRVRSSTRPAQDDPGAGRLGQP